MMMGHINHSKCTITDRRTSTMGRKDGKKEIKKVKKGTKERKKERKKVRAADIKKFPHTKPVYGGI